jgi:hypothetical protein
VPNGSFKIVYADGAGSGAKVNDVTSALDVSALRLGGTAVSSTAAELNIMDGGTSATSTTVVDADRVVYNDAGTMKQVAVTDMSTYYNANAFSAPSAITSSSSTLTPSAAKSIYQRVDSSSNNVALTLAVGSLAVGQYIIIDKTSTSNTLTLSYPSNSQGVSLGSSVEFAFAIYNGSHFSFIETVKS